MALCNITGTIYIPNGDVAAGYNVYLTKQQENVAADYLGSVIPETIRVQVDSSGEVDFNILSGMYSGVAGPRGGGKGFSFTFAAPDAQSALFEDCIDAVAPDPVPPEWLQRVEKAVADAEAAADAIAMDLETVIVATGPAGSVVTYQNNVLTIPRGDPGASVVVRSYTDLGAAEQAVTQYPNDIITYKPEGA